MNKKYTIYILMAIILLGLILRLMGITWGLPTETESYRTYHPDEAAFITAISQAKNPFKFPGLMFVTGTFNIYTQGAALKLASLFKLFPIYSNKDMYINKLYYMDRIYLVSRIINVIYGTATIWLLFMFGQSFFNKKTGLFAALLLAICAQSVVDSKYGYNTGTAPFWALLTLYTLFKGFEKNTTKYYIILGIVIGISANVQINTGTVAFLIPVVYFLNPHNKLKSGYNYKRFLKIAFISLGGFIAGLLLFCPSIVTDFKNIIEVYKHWVGYSFVSDVPYANLQPNAFLAYLIIYPYQGFGVGIFLIYFIGLLLNFIKFNKKTIICILYLIFNLLVLWRNHSYMDHYYNIIMPVYFLLAVNGWVIFLKRLKFVRIKKLFYVLFIAAVIHGFLYTMSYNKIMMQKDIRTKVSDYIRRNIPKGTVLGVKNIFFYSIPVVQSKVKQDYKIVLSKYDYDVFLKEKVEYIIVCDYEFGILRSAWNHKYNKESSKYWDKVFSEKDYKLIKTFKITPNLYGINLGFKKPYWHWRYTHPEIFLLKR